MKITFNWGTGISIAIVCFIIFILSFVYRSVVMDEYQHELVSEDYYKEELHYQEEIDKMENAKKLEQDVRLVNSPEGIRIIFPERMSPLEIEGTVVFKKLDNKKLDLELNLELEDHELLIPADKLVQGKWLVRIDWKYGDEEYLLKDDWFY